MPILELRKEMGLEIVHSTNIHEALAIFPALRIVFMELSVCVCTCWRDDGGGQDGQPNT